MTAPTIVFDLDGTLVDTAPDLVDALNATFRHEGLPALSYEAARDQIGGGVKSFIVRGLALEGRSGATENVDRLYAWLLDYYADHIADRSRPFPGLEDVLTELAADGCRLAVCTNKLEWLSVRLLDKLGLKDRFAAICGPDTFGMAKPNPEILRRTISRAQGNLARAVLIGDSATDVSTARAAGIPIVGVDFGYTEVPMGQLGADRVISSYRQLPAILRDVLGKSDPTG